MTEKTMVPPPPRRANSKARAAAATERQVLPMIPHGQERMVTPAERAAVTAMISLQGESVTPPSKPTEMRL